MAAAAIASVGATCGFQPYVFSFERVHGIAPIMNKAVFHFDQNGFDCQSFRDDADHLNGPECDSGGAVIRCQRQRAGDGLRYDIAEILDGQVLTLMGSIAVDWYG